MCNFTSVKQTKTHIMRHFVQITSDLINESVLSYSPELFELVHKEVKSTPLFIEEYKQYEETRLKGTMRKKEHYLSFMSNHLTTDSRLK